MAESADAGDLKSPGPKGRPGSTPGAPIKLAMDEKLKRVVLLIDRYLTRIFGAIRVYREDNEFLIPWGSTVINVEVFREGEEIVIKVYSPVALRVRPSKDLMRFLLIENSSLKMCSFYLELENGLMDILLGERINFDFLNKDLLSYVTINVGNLANEYSKEIIAVFGGISFKEYIEREKSRISIGEEKILHDIFEIEGLKVSLELYRTAEDSYLVVGKVQDSGQIFLKAERKKELSEVFRFMENLKKFLENKDVASLKRSLKHYEVEEDLLYSILAGNETQRLKKLKAVEKEIQFLTQLLMKGEISQEEYRKKISDLEKLL